MARVLSGIKPTGDFHLGNYIGAVRHWVPDQDVNDCFYAIVDLHAITVPQDPSELRRRTQFKDLASKQGEGSASAGLFTYPVLQAADILLYQTDEVPVGEDQRQHVELTRDIGARFNQRFGETFVLPRAVVSEEGGRIMDLQDPTSKMSKSAAAPGTIAVLDLPDAIRRKIRSAVTDSGRDVVASADKPAISNLLTIYSVVSGKTVPDLEQEYAGQGYAPFKQDLAEAVVGLIEPFQQRHRETMADPGEIERVLRLGADKARAVAAKTLADAYEKVGFLPRA